MGTEVTEKCQDLFPQSCSSNQSCSGTLPISFPSNPIPEILALSSAFVMSNYPAGTEPQPWGCDLSGRELSLFIAIILEAQEGARVFGIKSWLQSSQPGERNPCLGVLVWRTSVC